MANTKFVEGEKRYTGGVAIEVTPNKVINLLLREENNLLHVNDDNELYCDLQIENGIAPTDNFEVGVTTGMVNQADGWPQSGLLLHYEEAGGAYAQWLKGNDGKIYLDPGTGTFKLVYYAQDVDDLFTQLRSEISAVGYSGEYDDLLHRPGIVHLSYSEEQNEWIAEGTMKDNCMVMITPFEGVVPPTISIDGESYVLLGNEGANLNVYGNDPLVGIFQPDTENNVNYISLFLRKPDTAISATSTNTVENKVVKAALDLKANDADISTVGKSNDYNDLDNKPTIGAGVTTIKRNGTSIGTIGANQTTNGEINVVIPTKTSDITNDSGFITNSVNNLQNYMLSTNVQAGLDSKVNLSTTYNMCEITANEDGTLNEAFVNGVLSNTMQVIRNSLDKLFLRKANKNVTDQLQAEKASITYVNELVGSSLGVQTRVVDLLPAVGSSQYIYLVPDDPLDPSYYTKYVWDTTNQDYVNLGTTTVDLSNYVTLDGTQTITGTKTFSVSPVVPAKTSSAANTGTAIATEAQVYAKQDKLIAGSNISIANDGKTISATDTTYSRQTPASGGTTLSLVNTGDMYTWNNKQDAINDLQTIRSGASAGATAIQPNDNVSSLVNDAGYLTSSALAGKATATTLGIVKLGSNTVQSVAANNPSSEGSRTYPIQLNSNDQMVVNVPWNDTIQAIDDHLDLTSLNPVQNVVVTTALNGKQATLTTQTAYTSQGSASKVPQITTNSLGQVTSIVEKDITYPSQVDDTAYASSWDGVTATAPSKNAVYDKINTMDTTIGGKITNPSGGTAGQYLKKTDNGEVWDDIPKTYTTIQVTLTSAGWSSNEQTVTATGVTTTNTVIVSPAPSSFSDYTDAVIYCSAQSTDSLTFTCASEPSNNITVNVLIMN